MINTYLIQRALFKNNEDKKGIDKILSFDYMGNSDYEWGALEKSLKEIRNDLKSFIFIDLKVKDKQISVLCNINIMLDIPEFLERLANNEIHLAEFSGFDNYVNIAHNVLDDYYDFWWDITNHIMFWRNDDDFKTKFEKLIEG